MITHPVTFCRDYLHHIFFILILELSQVQMVNKDILGDTIVFPNQIINAKILLLFLCICMVPVNTRYWPSVVSILDQRRRRWINIETTLGQCFVFAGAWYYIHGDCFSIGMEGAYMSLIKHCILPLSPPGTISMRFDRYLQHRSQIWVCRSYLTKDDRQSLAPRWPSVVQLGDSVLSVLSIGIDFGQVRQLARATSTKNMQTYRLHLRQREGCLRGEWHVMQNKDERLNGHVSSKTITLALINFLKMCVFSHTKFGLYDQVLMTK